MKVSCCPICDSKAQRPFRWLADHHGQARYPAVRCDDCGGIFLGEAPAVEEMEVHYSNRAGDAMRQAPGRLFRRMQAFSFARELKPLLTRIGPGALLDLGAGDGALLRWAATHGREVAGIDFFPASQWPHPDIPYASADLHGGRFSARELRAPLDKPPEAVVMRHVLEHLHAPGLALRTLHEAGVQWVYIVVPNVESIGAKILGDRWYYWDPPRHLTFFSRATLRLVLQRSGFETVGEGYYGIDDVVTSFHRSRLLAGAGPESWLARASQPKGLLAGLSSAAASLVSNTVCWSVARRHSTVRP
jgi:hypothetical protein